MQILEKVSKFTLASWLLLFSPLCFGFVSPNLVPTLSRSEPLCSDRFNRDLDERSRRRAEGQGSGEIIAGAVLGTLIAGPFGTLCCCYNLSQDQKENS